MHKQTLIWSIIPSKDYLMEVIAMQKIAVQKISSTVGVIIKKLQVRFTERKRNKRVKANRFSNDYFIELIQKARRDLEQSKNFFANVTDPDLVDYAAHKILANQSYYAYLIKKAKTENITYHM